MTNIEEEISKLPKIKRERFQNLLVDVLYDRHWCKLHNINYANPDVKKAKEEVYKQFFDANYQ